MLKKVATFAVVVMGFAVIMAESGGSDADPQPAEVSALGENLAASPARPQPAAAAAAPVPPDAEWYGVAGNEDAAPLDDPADLPADDSGYAAAPAPAPVAPRVQSRPAPAPAPVVAPAPGYVPPPPPPQVPPSH